MGFWGRDLRRAARTAVASALCAAFCAAGVALAQNPTEDSATAAGDEPRLACVYEQLPTRIKLRFELAARVGPDAVAKVVGGRLGPAFAELVERCGFVSDAAGMARAEAYWSARAARMVAAIDADRAGLNVDTLELALLASGDSQDFRPLAEEMMGLGAEGAAEGEAGARVLAALEVYADAAAPLDEAQARLAATFVAAEIVRLGLEGGALPPTPEAPPTEEAASD